MIFLPQLPENLRFLVCIITTLLFFIFVNSCIAFNKVVYIFGKLAKYIVYGSLTKGPEGWLNS